ncbi:malto-oligosyltrehalose trehalohydrolase [Devosia sp.]|uniref:malto-oligosyltrehalose trehalohydrolase n=1 Tax=Devosia sp. TaxID=1871048 RepID=UPI0025BF478F|nr:malto-oligosyltrehalose trehalohydrolase [Devosia sp.]
MNEMSRLSTGIQREQESQFGTQILAIGVRFRLWAPLSNAVSLKIYDLERVIPMTAIMGGWYEVEVEDARAGMRYRFVLENGEEVPDPASRFQPEDVEGPSEIVDPRSYLWRDAGWRGRPWEEMIIYELHIGTFTPEGTFIAAIEKLDLLADLGVTAIEIMPIADFPGRWNWGYDGSHLFSPDSSYGQPEDLKALIDAAHAKGISVLLDVVYNHFGPKGNYLQVYAPLMNAEHETPWGPAVNFDAEGSTTIRDFICANARYWLNEYRFDGLRFDAVHEIRDYGPRHVLQDLAEQIRASTDGRYIHLVVENSDNHAGWLKRREHGRPWFYNAQWSDDIHHSLHNAVTGESFWYYADFDNRLDLVGRSLAEGLAWQGEYLEYEERHKGEPSAFLPATAFVSYAQNHDQAGNRPFGERINQLVPVERVRMWAAIYLLSPQIPMMFAGEEWATNRPFMFFSDVGADLADIVRQGREKEMETFPRNTDQGKVPDPMDEETFNACKLEWSERDGPEHAKCLSLYRRLIALRKKEIIPRLYGMEGNSGRFERLGERVIKVAWILGDRSELSLIANLSSEPFNGVNVWRSGNLWLEGFATGETLHPWSAIFCLQPPTD